jgi:hypothetical protein
VFFVYWSEVLPTQARVIGIAVVSIVGSLSIVFADLIITLCKNSGVSIMIIFAACAFVSILASLKLPETLNQPPPDLVEEIAKKVEREKKEKERSRAMAAVIESDVPANLACPISQ